MKESAFTVIYMIAITAVFTAGVTLVKVATGTRVERNAQLAEHRQIVLALGLEDDLRVGGEQVDAHFRELTAYRWDDEDGSVVYAALDDSGAVKAYAFPIGGRGFWGGIYGYIGINPEGTEIRGIAFTRHSETPGLGARIDERWFREQFKGLELGEPVDGIHIEFVSEGERLDSRSVHAITGATRTSTALRAFLNEDLRHIREAITGGGLARMSAEGGP